MTDEKQIDETTSECEYCVTNCVHCFFPLCDHSTNCDIRYRTWENIISEQQEYKENNND